MMDENNYWFKLQWVAQPERTNGYNEMKHLVKLYLMGLEGCWKGVITYY